MIFSSPIATYLTPLLSRTMDMPSARPGYAIIVSSSLPRLRFKEAGENPILSKPINSITSSGLYSRSCQQEPNVDYLPTFLADRTKFVRVYKLGSFLPYCRSTERRSSFNRKEKRKKESRGESRRSRQVSALNTMIFFYERSEKLGRVSVRKNE